MGNVIIQKPPHPSMKAGPGVILQAHLDMVCEKDSHILHDFSKDPIRLRIDGDWLKANGTTLGADNGIGIAAVLAVLEDTTMVHGPLEVLLTVDEERGLAGASAIERGALNGAYLLNFDSEEEGTFCIGCAGGGDTFFTIPVERKNKELPVCLEMRISGLTGGHSGIDIHRGRANALKVLVRVLSFMKETVDYELVSIEGGDKHNAIPRESLAYAYVRKEDLEKAIMITRNIFDTIRYEYKHTEHEMNMTVAGHELDHKPLTTFSKDKLINTLMVLPHGVLAMSPAVKDLVETSTNLASLRTKETHVEIVESSRSSLPSALEQVRASLKAFSHVLSPCTIEQPEGYPGWVPDPESPLLAMMKRIYRNLFGKEPEVKAVHAGLETGILGERIGGLKMISFGPDIKNPHSPDERVNVPSVERFWRLLTETLKELKD